MFYFFYGASFDFSFWRWVLAWSLLVLVLRAGWFGFGFEGFNEFCFSQVRDEFLDVHCDAAFGNLDAFNVEGYFRHVNG